MIELEGRPVLRVFAKHEPDLSRIQEVRSEMGVLGPPTIRCVEFFGELFAIEGSHRLRAAWEAGLIPFIEPVLAERTQGEDEAYWEGVRARLPHYAWLM